MTSKDPEAASTLAVAPTASTIAFDFESDLSDLSEEELPSKREPFPAPSDAPDGAPESVPDDAPDDVLGSALDGALNGVSESTLVSTVADDVVPDSDDEAASADYSLVPDTPILGEPISLTKQDQPSTSSFPVVEVRLPWIPLEKRREYEIVEVGEYNPEPEYLRSRDLSRGAYDETRMGLSLRGKRKRGDSDYSDELSKDVSGASDSSDQIASEDEDEAVDRDPPRRKRRTLQTKLSFIRRASSGPRATRTSSRLASSEAENSQSTRGLPRNGSHGLQLRPRAPATRSSRHDDGPDELALDHDDGGSGGGGGGDGDGGGESDDSFSIVRSDLQPFRKAKRRKRSSRLRKAGALNGSDPRDDAIGYEQPRRSGRSNKNTTNMIDLVYGDDDNYAPDEEKPALGAPKVASVKEVFPPLGPDDSDFKDVHNKVCDTCSHGPGGVGASYRGALIYCQGCSNAYHKGCIGVRALRDHLSTKIGSDRFVLQCKFCIGVYGKKDAQASNHAMCQSCLENGASCAPFSVKKTSKQEEQLRLANGGEDPVAAVDPQLVNNARKVLFRCTNCRRGYHFEHLPKPPRSPLFMDDDAEGDELRTRLLEEYSIEWKCRECLDAPAKVQTLVAWRPKGGRAAYQDGQTYEQFGHDEIEYLIKWDGFSYAHCSWMPGAWTWGATRGAMRNAFPRRNGGEHMLPRFDKQDAIPEEYVVPEIILSVTYDGYRPVDRKTDRANAHRIRRIYVKFVGLGYDAAVWDQPPESSSGYRYEAFLEAYDEYLGGKYFEDDTQQKMRERIKAFRTLPFDPDIEYKEQPAALRGGELMGYQVQGLNWLLYNFHLQHNAILADEMGLGKTVQIVALVASLVRDQPRIWPFLVVVPNATCANWRRELKKWAPDLRVVTYYGGREAQGLSYGYELFPDGSGRMRAHVVVMSYDSAQDDQTRARFKSVQWQGLVVDEGQRLKNENNLLYGALRHMRIPFRILLTGTPLQNNKRELFNLLQFIDSAQNAADLDEEYSVLTAENIPKLHSLIRPYFLRRTKAATLKFLPPIARVIVPLTMTLLQEKLCKSIMSKNSHLINAILVKEKTKATERGSLNNILMQLRKCLCHPFLYNESIEARMDDKQAEHANLVEASAKLLLLGVMLPKLKERGHRVLIFSQFLGQLTIMEDFLVGLGLSFSRLDGTSSSLEKQRLIDAYNAPDSPIFAMLLSTRAGGVGINLATADTVIILDPDFNPHQDLQAISRSHRIGQKNKVLCFQLMTKDSAEEKMMQIGRKKMALDHALIESMGDKEGDAGNDLESILKHGAEALFSEGHKDRIHYDSASVDKLLDRSDLERQPEDPDAEGSANAESSFSFARVWANDEGALTEDAAAAGVESEPVLNKGVWESILKEREEKARREAEANREVLGRGGRRRKAVKYRPRDIFGLNDGGGALDDSSSSIDEDFVKGASSSSDTEEGDEAKESNTTAAANGAQSAHPAKAKGKGTAAGTTPRKTPIRAPRAPSSKGQKTPTEKGRVGVRRGGQAAGKKQTSKPSRNTIDKPKPQTPKPRGRPRGAIAKGTPKKTAASKKPLPTPTAAGSSPQTPPPLLLAAEADHQPPPPPVTDSYPSPADQLTNPPHTPHNPHTPRTPLQQNALPSQYPPSPTAEV